MNANHILSCVDTEHLSLEDTKFLKEEIGEALHKIRRLNEDAFIYAVNQCVDDYVHCNNKEFIADLDSRYILEYYFDEIKNK